MTLPERAARTLRAGAGFPVLEPLGRHLVDEGTSAGSTDPSETVQEVLERIDAWLGRRRSRIRGRIDQATPGPLTQRLRRHLDTTVQRHRERLSQIEARAEATEEVPWASLADAFEALHETHDQLRHAETAARHLAEIAELVELVPEEELDAALENQTMELEAFIARHDDPALWAKGVQELEEWYTGLIGPDHRDLPDGSSPFSLLGQESLGVDGGTPSAQEGSEDPRGNGFPGGGADGRGVNGPRAPASAGSPPPSFARELEGRQDVLEREGSDDRAPPEASNEAPRTASPGARADQPPAGVGRLYTWRERVEDVVGPRADELRHATLWAPMAAGVGPFEDRGEELLDHASELEVDLVDVELVRVLALDAGAGSRTPPRATPGEEVDARVDPARLHRRMAERAEAVTRREPTRPAREVLLDYLLGKLPERYRDPGPGRGLVESAAIALSRHAPWDPETENLESTIEGLLRRELERTPVVDVAAAATSLLGSSQAPPVHAAARSLSEGAGVVELTEDGLLVLTAYGQMDGGNLHTLRRRLAGRLGAKRAESIVDSYVREVGEDG